MALDANLEEAQELFAYLAEIQRLSREADESKDPELLLAALRLLEMHTYDVHWRDELAARPYLTDREIDLQAPRRNSGWLEGSHSSPQVRIERARESGNAVELGNMLVRHGLYRDALMAYNRSPDHRLECASNLNLLQSNWSIVETSLGKLTSVDMLSNPLLLNLALAHWSSGNYGNAVAVLLRLDLENDVGSVWLSISQIAGMLLVSALIAFDRNTLKYFQLADPVLMFFNKTHRSRILDAYLHLDLVAFEAELAKLECPRVGTDVPDGESPGKLIRDRLKMDWLYVHNKLPLPLALQLFGMGASTEYTIIDLLEDLRRWKAPYCVSTDSQTIELYEQMSDNAATADELAHWFKRDALALLWQRQRPAGGLYLTGHEQ